MSVQKTPVLSKKQQNKSFSNRKKQLKTIRNVLTNSSAVYWPIVTDAEKTEIVTFLTGISKADDKTETKPKLKTKDLIKFGVSEVYKYLKEDNCAAVLLEANTPYILVAHILTIARTRSIPLLCVKDLKSVIKTCYGFNSSTMCFMLKSAKTYSSFISNISDISSKKLASSTNGNSCTPKSPDVTIKADLTPACAALEQKLQNTSLNRSNVDTPEQFIKFSEESINSSSRKRKRRHLVFEPLLIKKIQNNPKR